MTSTPTPAALLPEGIPPDVWDTAFTVANEVGAGLAIGAPETIARAILADRARRPSPPPSGDVEARLPTQEYILRAMAENYGDGPHVWDFLDKNACAKAADEIHLLRSELTQERELRKAAEGVCACCGETKPLPYRRDRMGGYVCLTCVEKALDAAEAQLAQLRKEAVEVVKPFAEAGDDLDPQDRGVIWESAAAMSINAADVRAARIFLNANDGSDT